MTYEVTIGNRTYRADQDGKFVRVDDNDPKETA